jgi:hypothetical protein
MKWRFPFEGAVILFLVAGCCVWALTPAPDVVAPQANEVIIGFAVLGDAAQRLNGVRICEIPALPLSCHPLLSPENLNTVTRIVSTYNTNMGALPDAWQTTAPQALDAMVAGLDVPGRKLLAPYVLAVRTIAK